MALNAGTYEAQIIELLGDRGDVVRYTVADGTSISKGSLMVMTDPRTMQKAGAGTYNVFQPVAGIASADKVAGDGSTSLGVYTYGIFELRTDTILPITVGDFVMVSGANNQIHKAPAGALISGAVLGKAMETASASEEIAVLVDC